MQKVLVGFTALVVVAFGAPESPRVAAQAQGKGAPTGSLVPYAANETWVRGQVICKTCYLKDKANTEMEHHGVPEYDEGTPESCARVCSMKGRPLALLTDEGKIYTITGKLAAIGDVLSQDNKIIRTNEPNAVLVTHLSHTMVIAGVVTEKNGELVIDADRFDWNMDTKDWRFGSGQERKHTEGVAVAPPPKGRAPEEKKKP